MTFTFYQLVIRGGVASMTPYIIVYPDMVEINLIAGQ